MNKTITPFKRFIAMAAMTLAVLGGMSAKGADEASAKTTCREASCDANDGPPTTSAWKPR